MRICDVCYAETETEDMCRECKDRKSLDVLSQDGVSDEEITERFKELIYQRERNIIILTDKLRAKSRSIDII